MQIQLLYVDPDIQRARRAVRLRRMLPARAFMVIREWPRWDRLPSLRVA